MPPLLLAFFTGVSVFGLTTFFTGLSSKTSASTFPPFRPALFVLVAGLAAAFLGDTFFFPFPALRPDFLAGEAAFVGVESTGGTGTSSGLLVSATGCFSDFAPRLPRVAFGLATGEDFFVAEGTGFLCLLVAFPLGVAVGAGFSVELSVTLDFLAGDVFTGDLTRLPLVTFGETGLAAAAAFARPRPALPLGGLVSFIGDGNPLSPPAGFSFAPVAFAAPAFLRDLPLVLGELFGETIFVFPLVDRATFGDGNLIFGLSLSANAVFTGVDLEIGLETPPGIFSGVDLAMGLAISAGAVFFGIFLAAAFLPRVAAFFGDGDFSIGLAVTVFDLGVAVFLGDGDFFAGVAVTVCVLGGFAIFAFPRVFFSTFGEGDFLVLVTSIMVCPRVVRPLGVTRLAGDETTLRRPLLVAGFGGSGARVTGESTLSGDCFLGAIAARFLGVGLSSPGEGACCLVAAFVFLGVGVFFTFGAGDLAFAALRFGVTFGVLPTGEATFGLSSSFTP